jgi:ribosomal-protein-alanine N-acetyltransferase
LDDGRKLVGYYSYSFEDEIMWIGVGLKPKSTGKGLGSEIEFIKMKKYINY